MSSGDVAQFNQVVERLYIGDYFTAINFTLLAEHNITHILVCGEELDCRYPEEFTYKHLQISDTNSTPIIEYFEEVNQFIEKGIKRGKVLVHCAQGRSRSASFIVSFLMQYKQIKYKKAFNLLKKKHPIAQPNSGFIQQLLHFEQQLFSSKSSCIYQIC